jgi:hypothetical protein
VFTVGSSTYSNYEVRARVKANENTGLPGVIARASDDGRNFYMLRIHDGENGLQGGSKGYIALGRVLDGSLKELALKAPFPYAAGKWYQLRLIVTGSRLIGYVDDKLVFDVTDTGTLFAANSPVLTSGKAGIRVANKAARMDDFVVAAVDGGTVDVVKPVITLNGEAVVEVAQGAVYTDPGAAASDDTDGDLSGSVQTTGSVNTSIPGVYTIRYNVRDAAGNAAVEVTRTVRVAAPQSSKPFIIALDGALDRAQGLSVKANVFRSTGSEDHTGQAVVYFQLLRGHTPVSYVAMTSDIASGSSFVGHFDVADPVNADYSVHVFVADTLAAVDGVLPVPLSGKVTAE